MNGPLLAIFAHPDDETFSAAGLMAAAVEAGSTVTVLSATRGEAGQSAIPGLESPAQLGAVREQELGDAMSVLGVSDVRFLDYHDSGLAAESADPLALTNATIADVAAAIGPYIRELRPQTILTFGPDGIYGHPDHLHIHHAATRAILDAGTPDTSSLGGAAWQTPALYFATAPREAMMAMIEHGKDRFDWLSPEMKANLGTPIAEITHVLDIAPWAERKRQAIYAHQTQTGPGGPLSHLPQEQMDRWLSREHFVRASLQWTIQTDVDPVSQLFAAQPKF